MIMAGLFCFSAFSAVEAVEFNSLEQERDSDTYFNFSPAQGEPYRLPGSAQVDPRAIIANIISIATGFLGIIAVALIVVSGFQWMTAGGDEDAVGRAKMRLGQGFIGLILILASWSIGYYVVNTLSSAVYR